MIELKINNITHKLDADSDTPLLWAIRDNIGLTGTKYGCGQGLCGACTVYLNGQPIRSCITPLGAIAGKNITTIEGLNTKEGQAIQNAWEKLEVVQCGYCQSGQVMTASALLQANPTPNDAAINAGMTGNICRCATYSRIREAVKEAAENLALEQTEKTT